MSAPASASASPPAPAKSRTGEVRVVKVVVHTGVGESGEPRAKAEKVLEMVTHQKPTATRAKTTNRDFGIRAGQQIGAKVTLRGARATDFLERAFDARDRQLDAASIDRAGNFSFGVADYTDFAGMKYDPEIGIHGMDVCVELGRRGWRVRERRIARRPIPTHLRVSRTEAEAFLKERFRVTYLE